jgi:hypothetical protein
MKSYIIGQGDNQACKVVIPVPKQFRPVQHYIQAGDDKLQIKPVPNYTHESSGLNWFNSNTR